MRPLSLILMFMALVGLVLVSGCSRDEDPGSLGPEKAAAPQPQYAPFNEDVYINDFHVHFDGRTYENGETTFRWTVSGTGQGEDLDYFFVELPDCAPDPIAWSPEVPVRFYTNPEFDIYGMKWMLPIDVEDMEGRQYAITFPGEVIEGQVRSLINAGEPTALGETAGPCVGFDITGTVYVDANIDDIFDPGFDSGIGNVVVELLDGDLVVDTATTDAGGFYRFVEADPGTYTVRVMTTAYEGAFNGELGESFLPTGVTEREATVGPDAENVDFGWYLNIDDVVDALENDDIPTIGEGATFWKLQLRVAITLERYFGDDPPVYKRWYGPVVMHQFLDTIEGLYLEHPYQFTPGNELQEAYDLLRIPPQTELEELLKEMLITQLNFVSDQGIVGPRADLMGPIVSWGEGVVADVLDDLKSAEKADQNLGDVLRVFRGLNTGGGGTIDD